jgi:hypothetical protein
MNHSLDTFLPDAKGSLQLRILILLLPLPCLAGTLQVGLELNILLLQGQNFRL